MVQYETVEAFLDDLNEEMRQKVELVRKIILNSHSDLTEIIKWNAPTYVLNGEDRLTFNVKNKHQVVKLVLHMGATFQENKNAKPAMFDETNMIEWSSDIRGIMSFEDYRTIVSREPEITQTITRWLDTKWPL